MTAAARTTGAVAGLLVCMGVGLFGQAGWLAGLVLGLLAGVLLAGLLAWMAAGDMSYADELPLPVTPPGPVADAPIPEATVPSAPDDLRAIKGIGAKVEQALLQAGVTRYAQIAAWDDARIDAMAARIGRGASRIRNDDWVGQARALDARRGRG